MQRLNEHTSGQPVAVLSWRRLGRALCAIACGAVVAACLHQTRVAARVALSSRANPCTCTCAWVAPQVWPAAHVWDARGAVSSDLTKGESTRPTGHDRGSLLESHVGRVVLPIACLPIAQAGALHPRAAQTLLPRGASEVGDDVGASGRGADLTAEDFYETAMALDASQLVRP